MRKALRYAAAVLLLLFALAGCGGGESNAPEELYGLPPDTPVFVSKRSSTVHLVSDCCNMKHYREMTLEEAAAKGYDHCLHCF